MDASRLFMNELLKLQLELKAAKGVAKQNRRPTDSDILPSAVEIKLEMMEGYLRDAFAHAEKAGLEIPKFVI